MKQRVLLREEQLLVTARSADGFLLGGTWVRPFPWATLARCSVYALRATDLAALLSDAAGRGYTILSGWGSDRRGLRGFVVGIGAWGVHGRVECRGVDAWAFETDLDEELGTDPADDTHQTHVEAEVARIEADLRRTCRRLNEEPTPFRASALRWIGGLCDRLGTPAEPDGYASILPADVATLCRRAHVGGPIVHARTSLSPWVSIDRDRAFGQAMLEDLPAGDPVEIPLRRQGLDRWRPADLMRAQGVAEAIVRVEEGPLVPLLPLHRPGARFDRSKTIYPVGTFRGVWALEELAALEASGRGRVERILRAVTFEARPVLRDVVLSLRKLEPDLPFKMKRLEHLLYGRCARSLSLTRIGSGVEGRAGLPRDLLDDRALRRVDGRTEVRTWPMPAGTQKLAHPLWSVHAHMSAQAERGTMDRPDRSTAITAKNRIQLGVLLSRLDTALKPTRPGNWLGRVWVDQIDVEAEPVDLPPLPGASVRGHGPSCRIWRAGYVSRRLADGTSLVEGLPSGSTEDDLVRTLSSSVDPDGGPLAEGRMWSPVPGVEDPRVLPDQWSEPLHVDPAFSVQLGFCDPDAGA